MNERAVAYALLHSPCSGVVLNVHVAMAYHADREGEVQASTSEISAMARCQPNAVRHAQAHLVAEGVIEQTSAAAGSRSATYRIARPQQRATRAVSSAQPAELARPQQRAIAARSANAPFIELTTSKETHTELETAYDDGSAVLAIFAAWQESTGHNRAVMDAKRKAVIRKARKLYPDEDLLAAINGVTLFDHNMGKTNGKRYDDIALILRDAEHIERFRDAWLRRGERADPRQHKVVGGLARALERAT